MTRWVINVEHLVQWELSGESDVLEKNSSVLFCFNINFMWLGLEWNPDRCRGNRWIRQQKSTEADYETQIHWLLHFPHSMYNEKPITVGALRQDQSSPATTLGSWVRIAVTAFMRLFCICVLLSIGRGLETVWSLVQEVLPTVDTVRNWKGVEAQQRAIEP
jgi:hypothetical protein